MVRKRVNASFPDKMISETILDYAAPLLEAVVKVEGQRELKLERLWLR